MVPCLQAVQKLVLAELCAADRVPPLVHASHRGRSHRLPVQQGSGGAGDGHISASARDRHGMGGSQVVVVAEQFVVLQKHKDNIIRNYILQCGPDFFFVRAGAGWLGRVNPQPPLA